MRSHVRAVSPRQILWYTYFSNYFYREKYMLSMRVHVWLLILGFVWSLGLVLAFGSVLDSVAVQAQAILESQTATTSVANPVAEPISVVPTSEPVKMPVSKNVVAVPDDIPLREDPVDPQELIRALQDLKQQRVDLKGLERKLKRSKDITQNQKDTIVTEMQALFAEMAELEKNIKAPPGDLTQRQA